MSGAAEWSAALSAPARRFTLTLRRLGIRAECRALTSAEVGECLRMGGERGARYALWLSCAELREAGEHLRKEGALHAPFDLTERLPYADALAAAGTILRFSGAERPLIGQEGGEVEEPAAGEEDGEEDGGEAGDWLAEVPAAFRADRTERAPEALPTERMRTIEASAEEARTSPHPEQTAGGVGAGDGVPWPFAREPAGRETDPDGLAVRLLARLRDAAGNM